MSFLLTYVRHAEFLPESRNHQAAGAVLSGRLHLFCKPHDLNFPLNLEKAAFQQISVMKFGDLGDLQCGLF